MKGITPVIAMILLLLITIAMVGFAFVWFSRVANIAANSTEAAIGNSLQTQGKTVLIDNVDPANTVVYIRNYGTYSMLYGPTGEIRVYVNGADVTGTCAGWTSNANASPGSTISCDWSGQSCTGSTDVKVTAPGNNDERTC